MKQGEALKLFGEKKKINVSRMSRDLGVNNRTSMYAVFRTNTFSGDTAAKVKSAYPDFEDFYNALREDKTEAEISKDLKHFIPYYANVNASAGLNFLTKNATADVELISVPNLDVQAFINVFGDSMYPKYCSGEIIGIKEVEKEYLMFGHAYVVQMKDGEVYLKYIKKGRDDKHWSLASENAKYEPKDFHLDRIDKVFIIKAIITKTTM